MIQLFFVCRYRYSTVIRQQWCSYSAPNTQIRTSHFASLLNFRPSSRRSIILIIETNIQSVEFMNINPLYRIVDLGPRGKIAVATRDLMPGELVLHDEDPLLFMTPKLIERCKRALPPGMAVMYAGFLVFLFDTSPEKKREFLALGGTVSSIAADAARSFAQKMGKGRYRSDLCRNPLSEEEVDRFVRVAGIVKLNAVGDEQKGYAVFGDFTYLHHSCRSNCAYRIEGSCCVCYTKHCVKAGEQLTISFLPHMDLQPTHIRRQKYLETKEFTCHCPRCDAPGDDTRQFDCFDPACKGVMMVCQPINRKDTSQTGLTYTGVEHVEPHLLPCTVCHRPPYGRYQAAMFELEKQMIFFVEPCKHRFEALLYNGRFSERYVELEKYLAHLQNSKFPQRHYAVLPHIYLQLRVLQALYLLVGTHVRKTFQATATKYLEIHHDIYGYVPLSALTVVVSFCSSPLRLVAVYLTQQDKELCRRALRLQLLQEGRECRNSALDTAVEAALRRGGPDTDTTTDVCAFCTESPSRAALFLMLCGRCQQVCYCSTGCQAAHWKLHRKVCVAVKMSSR